MSESALRYATRQSVALALAVGLSLCLGVSSKSVGDVGSSNAPLSGRAHIIDGDTIVLGGIHIRLEGIDAPETAQTCARREGGTWPCGQESTKGLASLIDGKQVSCTDRGLDKYGRVLGTCKVGMLDINAEMVRRGLACAFVRYSPAYAAIESEAKAAQRGIWQAAATPAWDFRAQRWAGSEVAAPNGCAIKGNVTRHGRIYHMPWSPWYGHVQMGNDPEKRWFCSEAEAITAGWRPAGGR